MHFCTLAMRGCGDCSVPMMYGMNGTMPATVKRSEGSGEISEVLGATWWPRSEK